MKQANAACWSGAYSVVLVGENKHKPINRQTIDYVRRGPVMQLKIKQRRIIGSLGSACLCAHGFKCAHSIREVIKEGLMRR